MLYLAIAGDRKAPLNFVIERDGDIIATTGEVMNYENNAVSGSPKKPTPLVFKHFKSTRDGLYDLSGRKLSNGDADNRKLQRGVYISNGRKQLIK